MASTYGFWGKGALITKQFLFRNFAVKESKGLHWRWQGRQGGFVFFWMFTLGEVPATGTAGEKGTTEKLRPLWGREGVNTKSSKLWEGMGSRGVNWLTQVTNLWVVGLALNAETHGLASYISIPAITVGIPQERSRGSRWSKHEHAWTYSCPSYLLGLHSGVGWVVLGPQKGKEEK